MAIISFVGGYRQSTECSGAGAAVWSYPSWQLQGAATRYEYKAIVNQQEYWGCLPGLKLAWQLGYHRFYLLGDSLLVFMHLLSH